MFSFVLKFSKIFKKDSAFSHQKVRKRKYFGKQNLFGSEQLISMSTNDLSLQKGCDDFVFFLSEICGALSVFFLQIGEIWSAIHPG